VLIPNIPNIRILDSEDPHPEGYVTRDGKWAAIPCGEKYVIICNGEQVHISSSFHHAKNYILKKVKQTPRKRKASSTLEEYL